MKYNKLACSDDTDERILEAGLINPTHGAWLMIETATDTGVKEVLDIANDMLSFERSLQHVLCEPR